MDDPTLNLVQRWQQSTVGHGEVNPISIIYFCLLFFFFLLLLLKLLRHNQQKNTNNKLPPSPPKLPIIGNLHQIGMLPHQSFAALSEKYGPLMLLKLGQTPTLVVSSAKMAKEVMKTHDIKFSNRPQITIAKLLLYGSQDMVFAPYGEYWRQVKKMCVIQLLSAKKVDSFQYVRDEEVGLLMDRIRKGCVGGECVNLSHFLASTSNNIASRCIFGEKFEEFHDVSKRFVDVISAVCVADFFPAFGWIDVVRGFIGELKTIAKTMDEFFDMIIEEHKAKLSIGKAKDKMDFVDIMLQLQQQEDHHFTQDNLKAIFQDMHIGGSDTTSTAIEWTMAELIRNPRIMKKVQKEVRRIVGKKAIKIERKNEINKMLYMKCVIKESVRLHPPIPLLLPRQTSDTVVDIEGYHVASGTNVFVNAWAIQRDPNIWESPNEFVPERFMNKINKNSVEEFELIPFGGGRRKCPGMSFGLASFECQLANLLYWFDWKLPDDMAGELLDMTEQCGIPIRKKIPLHLKPLAYERELISHHQLNRFIN